MTKKCPECGSELPDEAHFCVECGHDFFKKTAASTSSDSIFSNGKIFLILIAVVIIIGAFVILTSGFGSNDTGSDVIEHAVDLTITKVGGWENDDSYTIYTEAIFNKVPSDLKGYNVKTTYLDKNNTEIGYEIETLDDVYYESNYALSFAYYDSYKKPVPYQVNVEIIKDGKTVDNFTSKVDQNKIKFLN